MIAIVYTYGENIEQNQNSKFIFNLISQLLPTLQGIFNTIAFFWSNSSVRVCWWQFLGFQYFKSSSINHTAGTGSLLETARTTDLSRRQSGFYNDKKGVGVTSVVRDSDLGYDGEGEGLGGRPSQLQAYPQITTNFIHHYNEDFYDIDNSPIDKQLAHTDL